METQDEQPERDPDGAAKDADPGDNPEGATPEVPRTSGDPLSEASRQNPQPSDE